MRRFKKIRLIFLLGIAFLALAGCKGNGLANEDILERSFGWRGDCGSCKVGEALERFKLTNVKSILIAGLLDSKTERLVDERQNLKPLHSQNPHGMRKI